LPGCSRISAKKLDESPGIVSSLSMTAPLALATWKFGLKAIEIAAPMLSAGSAALDAAEAGVNAVELDPEVTSVGYGGYPGADGEVTLDAAIMTSHPHRYGAVAALRGIATPCSVARRVMEKTPHCLLAGEGARKFALDQGFTEREILTPRAREAWEKWKAGTGKPPASHDTIGFIARDKNGIMAAVLSTSGLAWKLPGRVGDSPIAGAGLFLDAGAGAACGTGVGEEVMRTAGCAVIVELMRHGKKPQAAVEEALRRILKTSPDAANNPKVQVAYLAFNLKGEIGSAALAPGFDYAIWREGMEKPELAVGPVIAR
jgi:isoaspartyl peptidase/L-asparaginase-like protein (Ntn-hydrolase superfamily)